MITSDEIINAADNLSINVSAIIMRTRSTNFQEAKKEDTKWIVIFCIQFYY